MGPQPLLVEEIKPSKCLKRLNPDEDDRETLLKDFCQRKFDDISSPTKIITSPLSPTGSPLTVLVKESYTPSKTKMPSPSTSVSPTMTATKWLQTVIAPLPAKPSAELEQFFSSCERDITLDVGHRVQIILEAIFLSSTPLYIHVTGSLHSAALMDSLWAEQRRLEALKLYYRVLSFMCRAESQKLCSSNLTSLLTNERFHRCMLACSAELVLETHKVVTMMFPAVLEPAGITAFDFSKVIESFIRHEETLPRELKRHLNSLEKRLLESMAWEKGSSIYNSLIVAKPGLSAVINQWGLLAEPMPSLDDIALRHKLTSGSLQISSMPCNIEAISDKNAASAVALAETGVGVSGVNNSFVSPVKVQSSDLLAFSSTKSTLQPPLQSSFASPTQPFSAGGGKTCAEAGINLFFQKILKLAAIRIKDLSERLNQPIHFMEQVYWLVKYVLYKETSLFFNRYIDQIILCGFYGISKVFGLGLEFQIIIAEYRKQSQCKHQVFHNALNHFSFTNYPDKTRQDVEEIIAFYNKKIVFIVRRLFPDPGNDKPTGLSARLFGPSPFSSLPDTSPKKVSVTHNVYVSPLHSGKREKLSLNHSNSLYACVGESTHPYRSPSKDLMAINNRLNSRHVIRRLNFDDACLVSDAEVARSLSTMQMQAKVILT